MQLLTSVSSRSRIRVPRLALSRPGLVGLALTVLVLAIAFLGPLLAPHDPDMLLGQGFTHPSSTYPLGLDYLGRDVLSRFLWGGQTAILVSLAATVLGSLIGIAVGTVAAYAGGATDTILNRAIEIALAFPSVIFILLLVTGFGSALWLVVVALAATHIPRVARIVRGASLGLRHLPFVEVAEARGESRAYILSREILPNILAPIGVDFGMRFAGSIIVVAGVSFLGFGLQPPASDWGLMISENRGGLLTQPWAVIAPLTAIAMLTIGVSLMVDGIRRSSGLGVPDVPGVPEVATPVAR